MMTQEIDFREVELKAAVDAEKLADQRTAKLQQEKSNIFMSGFILGFFVAAVLAAILVYLARLT